MSNMAYCRFSNTLADLQDCYAAMADLESLDDLSPEEARAARRLVKLCERISDDWIDEVDE